MAALAEYREKQSDYQQHYGDYRGQSECHTVAEEIDHHGVVDKRAAPETEHPDVDQLLHHSVCLVVDEQRQKRSRKDNQQHHSKFPTETESA